MAWPDDLGMVACVGFHRSLLPYLQNAIDNERITPIDTRMFAESAVLTFDYLGFRYELEEFAEVVTSIKKIAKIDEDEEGNEVILEDYEVVRKQTEYRDWGDF